MEVGYDIKRPESRSLDLKPRLLRFNFEPYIVPITLEVCGLNHSLRHIMYQFRK
jgi:hypothetical protein